MRIPRIFLNQVLRVTANTNLPGQERVHYIKRVLRLGVKDKIILFNNTQQEYQAIITKINKDDIQVDVVSETEVNTESSLRIHLGQVISKGERMDFSIQKSTELGVTEITPLLSQYCDVQLSEERLTKKMAHWQSIAIHACEQSGRTVAPKINSALPLLDWLTQTQAELALLLHPTGKSLNGLQQAAPNSIALLTGPEGGFSEAEIDLALKHKFNLLQLGPRILRTETAAMVAISLLQYKWGDL